ncbi:MAG: cupin domain-containing protein [Thermoleophilia bacterium]|nr:cupin domain-containing protein [Thermoleophilia bacterium]
MKVWNLVEREVEPRKPQVIGASEEGRAILINLPAGDSLSEHQVRERATVVVLDGAVEITARDGQTASGGAGTMVVFEPAERHSLLAREDARFLLLLAPWASEDHSSMMPWHREGEAAS